MAGEHGSKRMLFRELVRLAGESLPASEAMVVASLGGEGLESELRRELDYSRETTRLWIIERERERAESLRQAGKNIRVYQGRLRGFPLFFDRSKETAGIHLLHWDLANDGLANIQQVAQLLPLVWRSETRLSAVTVDERCFGPTETDFGIVMQVAEGFFETNLPFVWRILLELYSEGGADPRVSALRELATLLCMIMAPIAPAAVNMPGLYLAPLEFLRRLGGAGNQVGWFMAAARRHMRFLPTDLVRYVVRCEDGTLLRTYVFRSVRTSEELWDKTRSWEGLLRAPLLKIGERGVEVLRERQTTLCLPRPAPAQVEIADLVREKKPPPARVEQEEDGLWPWIENEEEAMLSPPVTLRPEDEKRLLETQRQLDSVARKLEENMADLVKAAEKIRNSLTGRRPSKAAPAAAGKPVPAKKTEADHAYDRLQSLKDVVSPLLWQNIETLYAEAKRGRRPDHGESIAKLEAVIRELLAEHEDTGQPVPPPSITAPAKAHARKAKPKPKPAVQNGTGNGADLEQQVLHALKGEGKMRTEHLTKAIGMDGSNWTLRAALKRLRDDGKIRIEGEKRGTTYELVV